MAAVSCVYLYITFHVSLNQSPVPLVLRFYEKRSETQRPLSGDWASYTFVLIKCRLSRIITRTNSPILGAINEGAWRTYADYFFKEKPNYRSHAYFENTSWHIYCKAINQKLYFGFVDFKKAYDTVWKDGLIFKLLSQKINASPTYKNVVTQFLAENFNCKFEIRLQCLIHVLSKHRTSRPIRSRDIDRSVFYQKVVCLYKIDPWSYRKIVYHWMMSPLQVPFRQRYLYESIIQKIHFKAFGISSS